MSELNIGDRAPGFSLPADNGETLSLDDFAGKLLIIYFYPKDDTPGCTKEACAFRDNLSALNKLETAVLGVSKDSVQKHEKFRTKHDLNFPLLSDENGTMCEDYGVWVEKNMYGRKYMGIERATFLIGADGTIAHIWRKVKVAGHAEDILEKLDEVRRKAA